jgi:glycerophosphoryl diester phosphodiesterase
MARDCGADFIVPHWRLATASFCRRAHKAGLPVMVWTVDRMSTVQEIAKKNILAIITNDPLRLKTR